MIGAARYFAPRMFAPTYWPKLGEVITAVVAAILRPYNHLAYRRRRAS